MVVQENDAPKKKGWFSRSGKNKPTKAKNGGESVTRPPSTSWYTKRPTTKTGESSSSGQGQNTKDDDELPERMERRSMQSDTASTLVNSRSASPTNTLKREGKSSPEGESNVEEDIVPAHAGFNIQAIKDTIASSGGAASADADVLHAPTPRHRPIEPPPLHQAAGRTESAPPPLPPKSGSSAVFTSDRSVTPIAHARARVASAPGFGSEAGSLETNDNVSAIGLGTTDRRSDLASAFGRSVSLNDTPSGPASGSTSSSSEWATTGGDDDDEFGGFETSSFRSPYSTGMSGRADMSGFGRAGKTTTLTFGGAGGSVWDAGDMYGTGTAGPSSSAFTTSQTMGLDIGASGMRTTPIPLAGVNTSASFSSRGSDAFASSSIPTGPVGPGIGSGVGATHDSFAAYTGNVPSSSLAVSPPPPDLPADILNPFAASQASLSFVPSSGIGTGSEPAGGLSFGAADGSLFLSSASAGGSAETWTPPPLVGRGMATGDRNGEGRGSVRKKQQNAASASMLNLNPWG